ncbi:MAG: hypothetical protein EA384_08195 [Spirochaetaceae bacterium]|nr:MAG: hypothetical protein EA384_08195 [Spirochaetaceae bacterium]
MIILQSGTFFSIVQHPGNISFTILMIAQNMIRYKHMRVRSRLRNILIRALTHSMDVQTMVEIARRIIGNEYDLHKRCGFPESVPIPDHDAARQIVIDLIDAALALPFVTLLVSIDRNGFVGRKLHIHRIDDILGEMLELGLTYDPENQIFVENANRQQTPNWGVIREGDVHSFAFLRFDVVGNSRLVRKYNEETVMQAYGDLRRLIQAILFRRNGRLWSWEGDGGLAAFYTDDVNAAAVYTGMEILRELYLYNRLRCPLEEPIRLRLAVHSGPSEYRNNVDDIGSMAIKKVYHIESNLTLPDTLTVSDTVYFNLDPLLESWFSPLAGNGDSTCYRYALAFEK